MTAKERYATPAAFRRALTDRLKELAKESRWTLQQLQRQVGESGDGRRPSTSVAGSARSEVLPVAGPR